jgi:hypothetical protein
VAALEHSSVPFEVIADAITPDRTDNDRAFAAIQFQFVLHAAFAKGRPDRIAFDGIEARVRPRRRRAMRGDLTVDLFVER